MTRNLCAGVSASKWRMGTRAVVFAALLAGSLAAGRAQAQVTTRYTVTDLGAAPGTSRSYASAMNDAGIVVGLSDYHAVRFNGNGTVLDFGVLDGEAAIFGINNSGVMVGFTMSHDFADGQFYYSRALRFNSNGTVTALSTTGFRDTIRATAINDANVIVGNFNGAARFSLDGKTIVPIGPTDSVAYGMSGNGLVAGAGAVLFSATATPPTVTPLPTLPDQIRASAYAVNNAGDAVGDSLFGTPLQQSAIRWKHGSNAAVRIGPDGSAAYGIDENGTAVGMIFNHAVLWGADNTITDLNTALDKSGVGWQLNAANASNKRGQIAGTGLHNGKQRAFLLTPNPTAPLPATRVSITLSRDEAFSGDSIPAFVRLSGPAPAGGAVVALTSPQPQMSVPAQVTVAAGKTTAAFTITTIPLVDMFSGIIGARYGDSQSNAFLSLDPTTSSAPSPNLVDFYINPSSVQGGAPSAANVTLDAPAGPGPIVVTLSSDHPDIVHVPASVTVAVGQTTSADFVITTSAVTAATQVGLSATLNGTTVPATMLINPPPASDTVTISQADYRASKKQLTVSAASTKPNATLKVYVTATSALIGTLTNKGGGNYGGTFSLAVNPKNITVKSSGGGKATRAVKNL